MSTVSARTADSVAVDDDAAPSSPTLVSTNRAIAAALSSPRVAHISAATFASRANRESDVAARAATVSGTFTRISASNFAVAFDPAAARRAAGSTSALLSAARTLAASSGSSTTSTSSRRVRRLFRSLAETDSEAETLGCGARGWRDGRGEQRHEVERRSRILRQRRAHLRVAA